MNKQTQSLRDDMGTLAEDARALMSATAGLAGEKISDARQRATAALESGKDMYGRVHDKAVEGFDAADEALRAHPYQALGIALGVGALVGYLIVRYCNSSPKRAEAVQRGTDGRRLEQLRETAGDR